MDIYIEELQGSLWVASLNHGRLEGLEIDSPHEEVRWGSIYFTKILSVDKALDAVYVDLDGENTGIVFNKDVRVFDKKASAWKGNSEAIGKILKPGSFVALQAKSAYIASEDDENIASERKTPRMSMDISLQGRYLIYCPFMPKNRLSQRIRDKPLRKQLLKMMDEMEEFEGFILRAAAAGTQADMLISEARILKNMWDQIQEHLSGEDAGLVMEGPDAIQRTLGDQAEQQIDVIEVVTMDHFQEAENWCGLFAPDLMPKITPIEIKGATEDLALFDHHDIVGQIEDLSHSYVILQDGSNVILEQTSALTAIDVNRGGNRNSNIDINMQAAREIGRQLRLRNIGGTIMIDFLKMNGKKEMGKIIAALEESVSSDPCTVQIHGPTALGLMEVTRARRTPPLLERFSGVIDINNY